MTVCYHGIMPVIDLLLDRGADLEARNEVRAGANLASLPWSCRIGAVWVSLLVGHGLRMGGEVLVGSRVPLSVLLP